MLVKFSKPLGAMAVVFALCTSAWGQAAQAPAGQKNWKDRAEYDLYESITKSTDGNKRLELLNQWKEKYATTDFQKERLLLYLNTYQTLNQAAPMYQAAKDVVAADPVDPTGLYWLNMLAPVQPGAKDNAEVLDTAEKAAKGLDVAFAPDKKPANVDDAKWAESGKMMAALSHKTLGWVAASRKNQEGAETEYKESLKANPAQAEVAYSLGSALYAQKKVPEALFYFARAATIEGPGALPEANKKTINDYLDEGLTGYHGDTKGLDELKALAKANPTPPADYKLLSVTELHEMSEKDRRSEAEGRSAGHAVGDHQGSVDRRPGSGVFRVEHEGHQAGRENVPRQGGLRNHKGSSARHVG